MTSSSTFWTAYNAAVKNYMLPGVTLPDDNELFVLPCNVPFTSATGPLTDAGYNYLVYKLANSTLSSDGSTGNYATELNTYLQTVDQSSLQDPDAKAKLDQANADLQDAQNNLETVKAGAKVYYDELSPPQPPFEQWILTYPPYTAAQRLVDSAATVQRQAYNEYWGRIIALQGYQDNLTKALDTTTLNQLYNMSVQKDGGDSTFAPYYSSTGLKNQLNSWIQGSGQEQEFFEVKVDFVTPPGATIEQGIYLKLTTKGLGKFDIHPGQWDVAGVKILYPDRQSGAPDVLNPKYTLPISFLIAYDPKLEVEIKSGQDAKLINSSKTSATAAPFAAIFGILGQHFPAN